jgi:hypothetical protein
MPSPHVSNLHAAVHGGTGTITPGSHASPGWTNPSPHALLTHVFVQCPTFDVERPPRSHCSGSLTTPSPQAGGAHLRRARVALVEVAVVAHLARLNDAVAAARRGALGRAAVVLVGVAVVALLGGPAHAVAADVDDAGVAARGVLAVGLAVVAGFTGLQDAVAAAWTRVRVRAGGRVGGRRGAGRGRLVLGRPRVFEAAGEGDHE